MVSSFVTLLWVAVTTMVVAIPRLKNGHYAYKSVDPAIEVDLDINSSRAALEVGCGGGYRTGWFDLSRSEEDNPVIHKFPVHSRDTHTYERLLASLRTACSHIIAVESPDLQEFVVEKGGIRSLLGGKEITLVRVGRFRWSPFVQGSFVSDKRSPIKQQFDILRGGTVYVKLGCDGGGYTEFMMYHLSPRNARRVYKLKRAPFGPSVGRLLRHFRKKCRSVWTNFDDYKKQLKHLRFVQTEEDLLLYGMGFSYDDREILRRREV
ncbi:hypothetical protein FOZ61_010809 [Perkinsus olseni]|uniref:Uncharacterized protein n=1 Tax=Perkinsus olseni TaxID=32597 RepID=A0A7J6L054_PEROL|nr:hypothetical protein FOZ61_010809 [Perkinsus olseni]KAF4652800.1 hypothetical protein FOL46_009498 [Perkinsus olseni]